MSDQTRWWWIRHAPVPDGGFIYGQRDLGCDCGDVEIFGILARELPRDAIWLTSNLLRTKQTELGDDCGEWTASIDETWMVEHA